MEKYRLRMFENKILDRTLRLNKVKRRMGKTAQRGDS
jgi:hypothetical protein